MKFENKEAQRILNALKNAKSGNNVFLALKEIPTENLKDMFQMIYHIFGERGVHITEDGEIKESSNHGHH